MHVCVPSEEVKLSFVVGERGLFFSAGMNQGDHDKLSIHPEVCVCVCVSFIHTLIK